MRFICTVSTMRTIWRVCLGILGGFLLAWGCSVSLAVLLVKAGMAPTEAVLAASMLAFLIYLGAGLWAFVARRLWLATLLLVGGGLALTLGGRAAAGI